MYSSYVTYCVLAVSCAGGTKDLVCALHVLTVRLLLVLSMSCAGTGVERYVSFGHIAMVTTATITTDRQDVRRKQELLHREWHEKVRAAAVLLVAALEYL